MTSEMPRAGDEAPDFTSLSTDGEFTLSQRVKNGPVLLYFYVVDYGKTCTEYIEQLNERSEEFRKRNITLYQVNHDTIEVHRKWMKHTGSDYQIITDPEKAISKSFGCIVTKARSDKILGYPNRGFFLIGSDMKVLYAWQADWPNDTVPMDELFSAIDSAIGTDVNGAE